MALRHDWIEARARWHALTLYRRFEHLVILVLVGLIAVVIIASVWNLALKILVGLVLSGFFDPTDHAVFQSVFGMIFTVIIALEFKRSLLIVTERHESVVQVRSVILIAMLVVVRKLILLDLSAPRRRSCSPWPPRSWRSARCTGWCATPNGQDGPTVSSGQV